LPVGRSPSLHIHTVTPKDVLYRIYRGANPAKFTCSERGNRFDPLPPPWAETRVLYAASSPEAALSETVLRWHDRVAPEANVLLSRSQFEGRQLVGLTWNVPLDILDLTGFGMKALGELVDNALPEGIFLSDRASYGLTRQWAAWLRSAYPHAAGIR